MLHLGTFKIQKWTAQICIQAAPFHIGKWCYPAYLRFLTLTFNNKLTKAMGISDHNRRKRIHCSNMILYWQAEPPAFLVIQANKKPKSLGAELYKGEKSRSDIYSIIINGCETRTIIRTMNHWVAKGCNNKKLLCSFLTGIRN